MEAKKISLMNAVRFSFNSIYQHFGVVVKATFLAAVPFLILGLLVAFHPSFLEEIHLCLQDTRDDGAKLLIALYYGKHWMASIITTLLLLYIEVGIVLGMQKIALNIYDDNQSSTREIYQGFKLINTNFLAICLYLLFVGFGFCLIIPGFYFAIRLMYFGFFIIDKNAAPLESLRMSMNKTNGHFWTLFLYLFCITLISLLIRMIFVPNALMYFFLRYFVMEWVIVFMDAFIYRTLVPRHEMQINHE